MKILILNGPNLNMLGKREPEIYGSATLEDIESSCRSEAKELGLEVGFEQSNAEHEIVDVIQKAAGAYDGIVINAAAYTHTSVAIHDALRSSGLKIIEVHLSNIYKREEFRHHSYISPVADGVICGLGVDVYKLALRGIKNL